MQGKKLCLVYLISFAANWHLTLSLRMTDKTSTSGLTMRVLQTKQFFCVQLIPTCVLTPVALEDHKVSLSYNPSAFIKCIA